MIELTLEQFNHLCEPSKFTNSPNKLLETKEQSKILYFLDGLGFQTEKIIVANKAGGADIFATSIIGQTWRIEVKRADEKKARKLQLVKLKNYYKNKAVCMIAYGFEDFKYKYNYISNLVS